MITEQDVRQERDHYETLYHRDGSHHFIAEGYEAIHEITVDLLTPGSRVLDIGCGSGQHSRIFAQKGFSVSGIEISETAVQECRAAFRALNLAGEFHCGDARRLPFCGRSFDASFMSLILHHFLDYAQVLREAARVSRRQVFVFEPNVWNPQSFLLLNVINPLFRPTFLTRNQRAVNPRHVGRILASCGFHHAGTHYLTVASTARQPALRRWLYSSQRVLPGCMRHNKFVQVYERTVG